MREMKDSGVEWLGKIPKEWDLVPIKALVSNKNQKGPYSGEEYIGLEHIESGSGRLLISNSRADNEVDSIVSSFSESDILFGKLRPYLAKVAKPSFEGQCSTEILVLSPSSKIDRDYLFWYLLNPAFIDAINASTYGAKMPRANWDFIGTCPLTLPSLDSQKKITNYLYQKCAQVDALIANVRAQIEKLKAYKQSLITEVVTKGLDPTVPMKDSGVEWIGEIPAHWSIVKARRIITSTQNGMTRRDMAESTGHIVLKLKNISAEGCIDYSYINRIQLTKKEIETYSLRKGDFLFVRVNGSRALVGKCAIFSDNGEITAYNDHIIRVRINDLCETQYFQYYLLSVSGRIEIEHHTSTSAGQYTISGEGLRDIWLVLPPRSLQANLCCFLNNKCAYIDRLIALKQAKIEKLEQYKRSLIYEYVTGKREVF